MATLMTFDWQTGITLAIGLVALVYLMRRWWPSWRGLWHAGGAGTPASCHRAHDGVQAPAASCGGGCGSCGSAHTPQRDHRITVRRTETS